jgi:hypothetical protein
MQSRMHNPAFDKMVMKEFKFSFFKTEFSHKDSKAQRKMRSIFLLRAFGPLWLTLFSAKL